LNKQIAHDLGISARTRKATTGLNRAATGSVLSFSQFTTVSVETPIIPAASAAGGQAADAAS
jgi:FixJ family two-component response regulator